MSLQSKRAYYHEFKKTKRGMIAYVWNAQVKRSKKRGHRPPEYTIDELEEWSLSQSIFHELHKEWLMSGCEIDLKPSLDRKNDDVHYCFSNVRWTTWGANRKKSYSDKRLGINNKQSKAIVCIDKRTDKQIKVYYSCKAASLDTGANHSHITQVAKGKRKSAGGYKWAYADTQT